VLARFWEESGRN